MPASTGGRVLDIIASSPRVSGVPYVDAMVPPPATIITPIRATMVRMLHRESCNVLPKMLPSP